MIYEETKHMKVVHNKQFRPEFNEEELSPFSPEIINNVLQFQKTHPLYTNTPLLSLRHLAAHLHVASIKVKDESHRFNLNAFKVMGGMYAIAKYLSELLGEDIENVSFEKLQSKEVKDKLGDITFITATDGNHGRGVAWAARELGQKSVVYMPKGSSIERLEAIRAEGAISEITDVNYDETVRMCATLASENNWVMVQDTAWEGYDKIPLWIMQGYSAIAKEIVEELEQFQEEPPTHVFLQAGVGSFAAGIAGYFMHTYQNNPPKIIIVEPELANCYYRSFSNDTGEREIVTGHMNSIMAGLCCGEPNTRAFRLLSHYALASISCHDHLAALGMRILGNPLLNDSKIVSGESGAIPLGVLYYVRKLASEQLNMELGLDEHSIILMINTEGDTDYQHYLDVVWKGKYPNE